MMRVNATSGRNRRGASPSECLDLLSRKRQELIRPVFEKPREYVLLSTRRLAQRLAVNSATAVRIVQSMGFASYKEFQRYLYELAIFQATTLDTMSNTALRDSSPGAHAREAIEQDIGNLQQLRTNLDFERIEALANRIHDARRILILGGELAANLVRFLHYHLLQLGLPAVRATSAGEMIHLTRAAGERDLVIAISFRRCLRQTVEGVKQAQSNGAHCVAITNTFVSPLARFAGEFFVVSVDSTSFGFSFAAPQALIDGIVAACGYCRPERNKPILKKVAEEQRKGFRWYTE
jgi:DNA-binding MurR/RpiR family transcriptional regulator